MKIQLFYLKNCPYCIRALQYWNQIIKDAKYQNIELELHEESEEVELANSYDYYYVPCFYYQDKKLHEGAITENEIRTMLDSIL